jgi:predicted dehydrogenase
VGFHRRFDPAIVELRRRIATGEVGELYLVRATAFDAQPPDPANIPTSGGIFRDLLIHDLDCVPWLVGRPVVSVHATGSVLVDAQKVAGVHETDPPRAGDADAHLRSFLPWPCPGPNLAVSREWTSPPDRLPYPIGSPTGSAASTGSAPHRRLPLPDRLLT